MEHKNETGDPQSSPPRIAGVGVRLTLWIVVVFAVTLTVFAGLDVYHEFQFAEELGATQQERATLLWNTIVLHAIHGGVTVAAFGVVMHFLVQRLLSRRIARLVLAIQHFRRGTWRVRIPTRTRDEIEWLTEAIRELGPDLEQKLTTYVEVDRKSVVARLGGRYERRLAPPARRIVDAAWREMTSGRNNLAWQAILLDALVILDQLESLGRPDHPTVADIVGLNRSADIVTQTSTAIGQHHGASDM